MAKQISVSAQPGFRRLRLKLIAFAAMVLWSAAAVPEAVADVPTVKIGLVGTNESQLPILLAIDQGLFKQQGIAVETINFAGGGVAIQAFVGGSIDLCTCATDHVVRLVNRGIDARLLIGIDRFLTSALIVPTDGGYSDLASLRGKSIGVSAPGSFSENTLRWAIKQAGLDPDRDFVIIGTGSGTTARAALQSKQVTAVVVPTPDVLDYQFTLAGRYKVLVDWRNIDHSGQAVIGRQRWVDANPAVARGIVRAVTEAERVIQVDSITAEHVLKSMFPERSDDYIKALRAEVMPRLSPDGRVSPSGFLKMIEIMQVVEPGLKAIKQSDVDLQPALSN